jgi:DNA repair exonuclease SbcCD ATPase subunit
MHVLNGSGKQRTFISLALRLALRSINNSCINDLLFLDELMGKLVENSVDEFVELLEEIKTKISKVFIVEHAYSEYINADYVLEVRKDDKGISSIFV